MEKNRKTKRIVIVVKEDEVLEIYASENNPHCVIITNKNGILQVEGK